MLEFQEPQVSQEVLDLKVMPDLQVLLAHKANREAVVSVAQRDNRDRLDSKELQE